MGVYLSQVTISLAQELVCERPAGVPDCSSSRGCIGGSEGCSNELCYESGRPR